MNIKAREVALAPSDNIYEGAPVEPMEDVEEASPKAEKLLTTMKKVVWFLLFNGVAWVWCSYILAWMGKEQIAEDLSKVALTEIIAVVLVYAVKSIFENLSKNNSWPDKPGNDPPAGVG